MKYVLITGASGDIGQAIAKQLAEDGYHLYLHYFQNEVAILDLLNELRVRHPKQLFKSIQADLSETKQVDHLVNQIDNAVDVIVHNSGKSHVGLITDITDDEAKLFIDLHIMSPFMLTKRLLSNMIHNRYGKIILITSIWGLIGASTEVIYSMVKGGQNSFIKALAKEVAPSGITVNGIAPGAIDTKMLSHLSKEDLQLLNDDIPMGRLGKPNEVASLTSYLISDQAAYINGQIISINGAWHC